ncbi:MAG: LemA family protein [Methanomicrobiales archaeon]|nr:LemA family protein [Methanomicrobiales archaeon]
MEPFETFIWKRIIIQIGGVIAIAAVLGGFVLSYNATYNSVVHLDQLADERWSRLTSDMLERYGGIQGLTDDLRPSLRTDVPTLDEVAGNLGRWRTALSDGNIGTISTATTNLEASLSRLTGVLREHPEVMGSREVQDFMTTLEGTEQRLSADRSGYNEEVQGYNLAISSFPASLWTYNWGFSRREYFTAGIGTRESPPVPVE